MRLCFLMSIFFAIASLSNAAEIEDFMDVIDKQTVEWTTANCGSDFSHWTLNTCRLQWNDTAISSGFLCSGSTTADQRPCLDIPNGTSVDAGDAGEPDGDSAYRIVIKDDPGTFFTNTLYGNVEKMNAFCIEVEYIGDHQWFAPTRNKQCVNCAGNGPQVYSGVYNNLSQANGSAHNDTYEGWHYYTLSRDYFDDLGRTYDLGDGRHALCLPNAIQGDRTRAERYRAWGPPYGSNGLGTLWTSMTYAYFHSGNFLCNADPCIIRFLRSHALEIRDNIIWEPRIVHNVASGNTYRFVLYNGYSQQESMLVNLYGYGNSLPDASTVTDRVAWVDGNDDGVQDYVDSNTNSRCDPGEDASTPDTCLISQTSWAMPVGNHVIRIRLNTASEINTLHLIREDGLEGDTVYLSTGDIYTQATDGASEANAALSVNLKGWDTDIDLSLLGLVSPTFPDVPANLSDSAAGVPSFPSAPSSLSDSAAGVPSFPSAPSSLSDSAAGVPSFPSTPTGLTTP